MNRAAFGRRGVSQPATPRSIPEAPAPRERAVAPIPVVLEESSDDGAPSLDEELRAWKQQRPFIIPWKQICLMATICFGVASFVLPATVNNAVDWLLWGLTAMSFYAWWTARRTRRKPRAQP